jgi:hypothetical protein
VDEMKIQERCLFHFLTSLTQEKELCSKILFLFLTSLPQRGEIVLVTSVSFVNELSTEKKNCSCGLSLIMASKRITLWRIPCQGKKLGHGFQEIITRWKKITLEGTHVEGLIRGKEIRLQ